VIVPGTKRALSIKYNKIFGSIDLNVEGVRLGARANRAKELVKEYMRREARELCAEVGDGMKG
jgi:hypothetical protein